MNQRVAKKLRKICNPIDPVSKRVYRRLKRQYTRVPHHAKRDFIELLESTFAQINLDKEESRIVLDQKQE